MFFASLPIASSTSLVLLAFSVKSAICVPSAWSVSFHIVPSLKRATSFFCAKLLSLSPIHLRPVETWEKTADALSVAVTIISIAFFLAISLAFYGTRLIIYLFYFYFLVLMLEDLYQGYPESTRAAIIHSLNQEDHKDSDLPMRCKIVIAILFLSFIVFLIRFVIAF